MSEEKEKGGFLFRLKKAILFGESEKEETKPEETKKENVQQDALDVLFAKSFTGAGGNFAYCFDKSELISELQLLFQEGNWRFVFCTDEKLVKVLNQAGLPSRDLLGLSECQATLTPCEFLMADTGQVLMSSRVDKSRQLKACPDVQLVVAFIDQICKNEEEAMMRMEAKYGERKPHSLSRLNPRPQQIDPNSVLETGGHGPQELFVFLLENESIL